MKLRNTYAIKASAGWCKVGAWYLIPTIVPLCAKRPGIRHYALQFFWLRIRAEACCTIKSKMKIIIPPMKSPKS